MTSARTPTTGALEPSVGERALALADRALDIASARAASGGVRSVDVEVTSRTGASALTRFANSFVHQNVAEDLGGVRLRLAIDGRVAAASLDGPTDDEALGRLADDALDAARVRPVDPDWPGLGGPSAVPVVDHWDDSTAAAEPRARAERVRDVVDAASGLETAGYCSTAATGVAYANSSGRRLAGRATVALAHGIARTATSDGSARTGSVALAAIDGVEVGRIAASRARTSQEPVDLEPGRYEVVLERDAVVDLLHFLFVYGFNGRAVEEGRSFVRLGERQLDAAIDIRDDATDPRQVGVAFDAEGTSKRPVRVVRDGVSAAVLHTRRTAAKARTESTGNAVAGAESWGALPENVILREGDRPTDELIGSVGRGLLVTDFWYTRILDPRTMVVTGLTRNGVWLIEGGRIVRPVRNLRFTQSYAAALAPGNVLGVGREQALVPGSWDLGASIVSPLHLASWNFTGNARG
jgi:predicted Zn-dependent protease